MAAWVEAAVVTVVLTSPAIVRLDIDTVT